VTDAVMEKHVNALNESFISFFKQGISSRLGDGSLGISTSPMCQICNVVDHVVIICSKIGDLQFKCNKCGLPHRMENCGLRCGFCIGMGHIKNMCWKNGEKITFSCK